MTRGIFITFEGGEGAGKSTQVRRLAATLEAYGCSVTITREPGGSPLAEAIRGLLLSHESASNDGMTQALLFAAARRDHVKTTIRPALAKGHIVLCDRFADSTRAYQGGKVSADVIETLIGYGSDGLKPDMTILLDLPPEIGLDRARARMGTDAILFDPFERSALAFHQDVRRRFQSIARAESGRVMVIDAGQEESLVADHVRQAVRTRFLAEQAQG